MSIIEKKTLKFLHITSKILTYFKEKKNLYTNMETDFYNRKKYKPANQQKYQITFQIPCY